MKHRSIKLMIILSSLILLFGCPRRRHSQINTVYIQANTAGSGYNLESIESLPVALSQTVDVDLEDGDFRAISLDLAGVRRNEITISESDNNQINLSVTILAATNEELSSYRESITHNTSDGVLTITSTMERQVCQRITVNEQLRVDGICVSNVNISIPQGMQTQIYYKGMPLRLEVESVANFIAALGRTSLDNSDKVEYIQNFSTLLARRNQILTTEQAVSIIGSIRSSNHYRTRALDAILPILRSSGDLSLVVALFSDNSDKADNTIKLIQNFNISIIEILAILNSINSDHYKTAIITAYFGQNEEMQIDGDQLNRILSNFNGSNSAIADIFAALVTRTTNINLIRELSFVSSDYYKTRMIQAYVDAGHRLSTADFTNVVLGMSGNSERANVFTILITKVVGEINILRILSEVNNNYYSLNILRSHLQAGKSQEISSNNAIQIVTSFSDNSDRYNALELLTNAGIDIELSSVETLFTTSYYRERARNLLSN